MATKSSVGWLILAFALAVPGVLFYQWYTHLDLEKKRALTTKVRLKDTDLFRNSPKQDKLINPIAPAVAPVAALQTPSGIGLALGAPPVALSGGGERLPSKDGGPLPADAIPASASPTPVVPSAPATTEAATPEVPQAHSTPAVNPFQAWRDPTLSPHDLVEIERLGLEKQLALAELKDRALNRPKAPHKPPSVHMEKLIDLQGIVSIEGRNKAIVNNDMVAEGDIVKTKAGPVKVMRITIQKVIFGYKQKTFSKAVNR